MMRRIRVRRAVMMGMTALLFGAGCSQNQTPETPAANTPAAPPPAAEKPLTLYEDPGAATPETVSHAVAVLTSTEHSKTTGRVTFTTNPSGGLTVKAELEGLPEGKHAMHVHLYGDCSSADAKSAGTHFNFEGASKHPSADVKRITGNLGEVEAGADGKASLQATIDKASLSGDHTIIGRAVIVHEKPNDPAQPPMGAAGGRLACGVIGVASAAAEAEQHAQSEATAKKTGG